MDKIDYKHGTFVIASTDTEGPTYEEFVEYCKEENWDVPEDELDIPGEDSDEFWEWRTEEVGFNWECDLENIRHCKEYNVPCVITGRLGLWWGSPDIKPEREETVYDAIMKCIDRMAGTEIKYVDGAIVVYGHHHDGTNVFTIKALSKKGIAKQSAEYKEHDMKRLPYLYAIGI